MTLIRIDRSLPRRTRIGIRASVLSAIMLIGIGIFWVVHPDAPEASFKLAADSDAAIRFSKIAAVFKAVGDFLPPVFVLLAIRLRQFRLAGYYHVITLALIIAVDMLVWGSFVPNAGAIDVLQHLPFAVPIAVAAYCFLQPNPSNR